MDEWIQAVREDDGLLMRDKALRAGIDPDQIMKALRTGRLKRVQRAIYVHRREEVRPLALARAAVIASGVADAVASHRTAARVHGIAVPDGEFPEHVTVRRNARRVRRKELIYHARATGLGDVEVRDGVPVTSVPRTLADIAGYGDRLNGVWAIDDALRRGLVRAADIRKSLDQRPGAPGDAQARTRLAESDGRSESVLETAGRLALSDAAIPLPELQYRVEADDGFLAFLDGAYPADMLGIEFDGKRPHGTPEAVFRDRRRQNRLHALGWTVLRFTWWDVFYGTDSFVSQVKGALSQRAA